MKNSATKILTFSVFILTICAGISLSASHQPFFQSSDRFLPLYQHYLSSLQTDGELLELDDGSVWKINPSYSYRINRCEWKRGDIIEISQTNGYSRDRFWITNKTKNSYVLADISLGPVINNPYTNQVTYVTQNDVTVVAGNGFETRWVLDSRDSYKTRDWLPGQAVIVGKNNSWFDWFGNSNVILYNVEKNHFVRAALY